MPQERFTVTTLSNCTRPRSAPRPSLWFNRGTSMQRFGSAPASVFVMMVDEFIKKLFAAWPR